MNCFEESKVSGCSASTTVHLERYKCKPIRIQLCSRICRFFKFKFKTAFLTLYVKDSVSDK